jgi:crotonobetainyl-CoA:carnitine CoA-transferase CaiB-like acyl-CoA transferase
MTARTRALEGVRVLDLGTITAGAATSVVLADFGADVLKVEWPGQPDPFRAWTQITSAQTADVNASPPFHTVNRNKRGVGVNLKSPEGREVLLRLAATVDIVVENFRQGVLDRLGIGFEELRRVNPRVILLSLTSQGTSGAVARYGSFGSTLDALGGLMSITGYGPEEPTWSSNNVNYPDQLVSFFAPGVALAALRQMRQTGEAIWVDFSQRESVTFSLGEAFATYSRTGTAPVPQGNRETGRTQGVYLSAHDDRWVAVSALAGTPADERLRVLVGASSDGDADAAIQRWVSVRTPDQAEGELRAAGIAASVVRNDAEVMADEQLAALDFFQPVHSVLGSTLHRGFTARLSQTPGRIESAAPDLGGDTIDVLRSAGYADEKITALQSANAIFIGNPAEAERMEELVP